MGPFVEGSAHSHGCQPCCSGRAHASQRAARQAQAPHRAHRGRLTDHDTWPELVYRYGGAIALQGRGAVVIRNSLIAGARAVRGGAVAASRKDTVTINNSTIAHTEARAEGGCLHFADGAQLTGLLCECAATGRRL